MLRKINKPADPYSPLWDLFWAQNPSLHRGVGADGVNDDASDDNGGEDDKSDNSGDDDKRSESDDNGDKDGDNSGKPSDAEAKLLKEVMSKKATLKEQSAKIETLTTQLKAFDGVDLNEVTKLLQAQKEAQTKDLEKKGEWEKLRSQMVEQQEATTGELQAKIDDLQKALSGKDKTIGNLTVGHSFDSSGYIGEKLTLTSSKARIIYGNHFEIEDGAVIAYDKPAGANGRTMLVNESGNPLGFEAAIAKIVDADPDRDHIVKAKAKPGSDSKANNGKAKDAKPELKGADKIAAALSSGK